MTMSAPASAVLTNPAVTSLTPSEEDPAAPSIRRFAVGARHVIAIDGVLDPSAVQGPMR